MNWTCTIGHSHREAPTGGRCTARVAFFNVVDASEGRPAWTLVPCGRAEARR